MNPDREESKRVMRQVRLGRAALRRRRGQTGMTLVEIMIVVIIMALIATAVGVAVLPRLQQARVDSTRSDAQTVRGAAQMYLGENPSAGCPSMEDLVDGRYIDASRRTEDAWGNAFSIECEGDDIIVISAGADGQFGTEDDVY